MNHDRNCPNLFLNCLFNLSLATSAGIWPRVPPAGLPSARLPASASSTDSLCVCLGYYSIVFLFLIINSQQQPQQSSGGGGGCGACLAGMCLCCCAEGLSYYSLCILFWLLIVLCRTLRVLIVNRHHSSNHLVETGHDPNNTYVEPLFSLPFDFVFFFRSRVICIIF